MTQLLPPKKEVALALLERSNVDVYLDPRAKGVVVPPQFRKEPRLILKIGLNMPVPIPDLRLDDESMSCTLSFNRNRFFCVVPWLSVFAMVGDDGRGMVWPDDVPQELAVRVVDERRPSSPDRDSAVASSPTPSSKGGRGKDKDKDKSSRIQPDAEPSAASERGGPRSKKPRKPRTGEGRPSTTPWEPTGVTTTGPQSARDGGKKEDGARPLLHAVPAPQSTPRIEKLDERREAPTTPRVSGADARPTPRRDRPPPSARPKRELPPYLRVVK